MDLHICIPFRAEIPLSYCTWSSRNNAIVRKPAVAADAPPADAPQMGLLMGIDVVARFESLRGWPHMAVET